MEMERINENTIRVLISNEDLDARGITILDLLGDHQQIEDFFYSILREVDNDHQFADNDSVTFQVMPTGNGLELFISKNNPDGKTNADDSQQVAKYIQKRVMEAHHQRSESGAAQPLTNAQEKSQPAPVQPTIRWQIVDFPSFEDLIDFARIPEDPDVASELYKYNHHYYLALRYSQDVTNDNAVKDNLAVAYEYGNPTATTIDFLSEHAKKIMSGSALATVRHYFN
jgi:adapter protein MecA 1/2